MRRGLAAGREIRRESCGPGIAWGAMWKALGLSEIDGAGSLLERTHNRIY